MHATAPANRSHRVMSRVRRFTPLAVFDVEATFKLLAVESGQAS